MPVDHVKQIPWYFAGVIAIAGMSGWLWLTSQFMLRAEIVEDLNEVKVQLYALQWQDAKRSVRWWKTQPEWPALNPVDMEMYEDARARVIHYRNEVLVNGGVDL